MTPHLHPDELAQWLSAGPDCSGPVAEHLETCDACASHLAREAQLELTLLTLDRERRCGTVAGEGPLLTIRERPGAPSQPWAWRSARRACAAVGLLCLLCALVVPGRSHGSALAATAEPCAGTTADGGEQLLRLEVSRAVSFGSEEHGTP